MQGGTDVSHTQFGTDGQQHSRGQYGSEKFDQKLPKLVQQQAHLACDTISSGS